MGTPDQPSDDSFHALDRDQWRAWLELNHTRAAGVWLITNKPSSGLPHPTYDEAVEEALCFGWVDSKPGKVDDTRTKLWFAPRKSRSGWSRPNKLRVERMIAAGKMTDAGLAKIHAAQADGTWSLLDAAENLEIPPDLEAAFTRHPGSREKFEQFPRSAKRGILEWIIQAKTPATRAKRLEETAAKAAVGERANSWKPKPNLNQK
jgi:uncharacterized protein YdeI (YjbR/CyaY-like superfamily)